MNDRGVEFEFCHVVVMDDKEMEVLKILAAGLIAMNTGLEMPPPPTDEQIPTLISLCQRIREM